MLVFVSYAHEDERLRAGLTTHLSLLKRQKVIDDWYDRDITAGSEWRGRIDAKLDEADIILLLVSADFLASDYCYDVEMRRAMQRHEAGEATVIPVFLRPVDWEGAPFGRLQGLPTGGRPVSSWRSRDEAFTSVARGIRDVAEALGKGARRDPGVLYDQGLQALREDRHDDAVTAFSSALDADPTFAVAVYNRGLAHFLLGHDSRAIADFDQALRLGYDDAVVYRQRGNAHSRRGDVAPALADYARAIELEPTNAVAYLNRGEVFQNTLQKALAIEDYRTVLTLPCEQHLLDLARRRLDALGVEPG